MKKQRKEPTEKVTILFTDMKGSSEFYKTHGNLAGRIMIQKLNDMLFPIVRAYKGIIVKTIGDSIMAYFLAPRDAIWASIAMQKKLHTYNQDHSPNDHLLVRISMNYGYGIIEEEDVFGDVVNTAAKLIACCDAQQIIVTESFYLETKNLSGVEFSLFDIRDKKEQLEDIKLYQVNWKNIKEIDINKNTYLFSVRIEKVSSKAISHNDIEKILPFIKRSAFKIFKVEGNEIHAVFKDSKACLDTARKTLQNYLGLSSEGEDLPHLLMIGLHAVHESEMGDRKFQELFNEPIRALNNAESYEIVITSAFYNDIPYELKQICIPVKNSLDTQNPFFLFHWEKLKKHTPIITSLVPDVGRVESTTSCFYCGNTKHPTTRCPSKLIQKPTNYLEKLGYMPLHEIRQIFYQNFSDMVKPLKNGAEEERFELLNKKYRNDSYSLGFFSFYEITEVFQLRSLYRLHMGETGHNPSLPQKTGSLRMGVDCLRVSRLEQAQEWFRKAIKEHPNDYRPHVAMGILSIEKSNPEQAFCHFDKVLSFPLRDIQKRHIFLLIARVYEVADALPHAQKEVEKALTIFHDWNKARYYLAVLLAKLGKIKSTIEILRKLLQQSPHYYLRISLNPELNIAKKEIAAFLNQELINIRMSSQRSFKNIKKTIDEYSKWLKKDDEDYISAQELLQKAADILQNESLLGLMDILGFEVNINHLLKNAFTLRQSKARKKITSFKSILKNHTEYLDRFPYKNQLSKRHFKQKRDFEMLLEDVNKTIDTVPPPSLQETQVLIEKLSKEAGELSAVQNRLEIMKNLLFTLEYSFKMIVFFFFAIGLTALFFTGVLLLYQGYEDSFSTVTVTRLLGFIKFGLIAGMFSGAFGTIIWFKKTFNKMHKKIEF